MQNNPNELMVYERQAALAKAMGNPDRLRILRWVRFHGDGPEGQLGEVGAAQLGDALELSKANLSRHLSKMREVGLVRTRKEGAFMFVREANPHIGELCETMRGLIADRLREEVQALEGLGDEL